jgi:multidrug efflux system membrane fusion protein
MAAPALDRGTLEVVDNQIDPTTGTVKLKATFPNANLQLWPGGFVNVRLTTETLRNVVVAPTAAIQRGPNGPYVYAVREEKAAMTPVVLGRQEELTTVVASGLAPSERVVTTGFARLKDGDRVRVLDPEPARTPAVAKAPAADTAPAGGRVSDAAQPPAAERRGEDRGEGRGRRRREGAPDGLTSEPPPVERPAGAARPQARASP